MLMEVLPTKVTYAEILRQQAYEIDCYEGEGQAVFGMMDVSFIEREREYMEIPETKEIERGEFEMLGFEQMKHLYYLVDSKTLLTPEQFDMEAGLRKAFYFEQTDEPQILIYHTHANEYFADSIMNGDLYEGIVGVGAELARILEEEYGYHVIHHVEEFDVVNGQGQRTGAYERMEDPIREVLAKYPSIEVCLDIHRDGVSEDLRLVQEFEGETYAKLMFVNGMTAMNQNGAVAWISGLENPYLEESLSFSLQMQLLAEEYYPDVNRKIMLNAYRLSTHFMPRSALVEVGAQTNTKQEALNSMKILASLVHGVCGE